MGTGCDGSNPDSTVDGSFVIKIGDITNLWLNVASCCSTEYKLPAWYVVRMPLIPSSRASLLFECRLLS